MKRTQVYLDFPTYQLALTHARSTGTTLSHVIRTSLKSQIKSKTPKNSLLEIAKLAKTFKWPKNTPTDLSYNLDHYVYGTPKKPLPKKWTR